MKLISDLKHIRSAPDALEVLSSLDLIADVYPIYDWIIFPIIVHPEMFYSCYITAIEQLLAF